MTAEKLIAARRAEPWREALHKSKKNKERVDIPRVRMSELDPEHRSHTRLEEVNLGLIRKQAMQGAKCCLDYPNPTYVQGCPVNINMPTFIKNVKRGEFLEVTKTLKETSALPAVCGRICPQEKQYESKCTHLRMGKEAVVIGYLEHFAAGHERESGNISVPEIAERSGIKIAMVGFGPAGLSFAGDVAKHGYDVTMFEALYEVGGVLKYGILEFRLPDKIVDVEIDGLRKMGARFERDCIVGKTTNYDGLHADGSKGAFVASGTGLPNFMNVPGESFVNVTSSNECLTRVSLMDATSPESDTPVLQGKGVTVIGGGNTAMDFVRTARRPGAERAMIVCRRNEEEIPVRLEGVKHAKEEGIEFTTLHNPIEYVGDERGRVKRMRLQKMELGRADASGCHRPVPIEGAIGTIGVGEMIVSIDVSLNPLIPYTSGDLEASEKDTIVVEEDSMRSALGDVYVGGDIAYGGAIVVLAMEDGRKAAAVMDADLRG